MPARHSTPASPLSTQRRTSPSQSWPAAAVTVTDASPVSRRTPLVAIRSAVPSKPSSPTTRLLPPPSTSSDSPCWSAARTSATSSRSVLAVTNLRAGPPRPSVVYDDSGTCCRTAVIGPSGSVSLAACGSRRRTARAG